MPINSNIALGVQPIQLNDPLAQYGKIAAIQGAQNQNALNQYQLNAAKRTDDVQNMLGQAYAQSVDPTTGKIDYNKLTGLVAIGGGGAQIPAIQKSRLEQETAETTRQKAQTELVDARLKQARSFLDTIDPNDPNAPTQYIAWHEANHKDPILGPILTARGVTAEQSRGRIMDAVTKGPTAFATLLNQSKLGTEKFMEMNKPVTQVIDQSGQRQLVQLPGLGGAPTTVGTYEDVPLPAAVQAQNLQRAVAAKPVTNITNVQEKAEAGEFGKLLVGQFDAISKQASVAARTLPSIEANLATLNKGLDTGFGTDAKAAGARVLGALGVKDADKFATDTQTFQSNAISAVLQKQLEQKGPQTESDARRIEQIGAELGKTKDANRFILDLAREQLRRDLDQRNFYAEWKKGPGKGSFNGAEDAWFAGEGSKSLFDRPALKKYAVGAASAASQIPGQGPATPAARPPAANVVTNPQFPGFSIGK
jgi:hypothetical protein